jgi:transposase InsO family protein
MTLYRRIHEAGIATILRRQPSPLEAQAGRAVGPGPRAQVSRILERVEIDHTLADVILVDETDRQPIGRPLVTLALDVYSGFPFGLYIGFEDASYLTVMSCLLHGILPKPDCRELYGTRHGWPAYGLPEKLVIDNGKEFVGRDLDDACGQLGIILEPMPARKPWYKGAIERFFGTLNTGLLHSLPGTTYSNTQRRGAYDSAREATISLPAFSRILHKFLLDEYAYRRHRGARGLPAELWAESAKGGFHPDLSWSSEEVTILLGRTAERTIGRRGISFLGLTYHSTGLAALHSALPQGTEVRFKYNPSDLGTIYVADPTGQLGWIAVPAEDTEYTRGLPLWKHRHLRARQAGQGQEDVYVPAEARRQIEAEVAREYQTTRKVRGRKQAARLLGIGTESEPARYTNRAPRPAAEPPPGALAPPLISLNTGDPPAAPAGSPTSGGNRLAQPSPQPAPRTRRRPAAHAADLGSDLAPRQREPAAADPAADQLQTADPPLAPPAPPAPPSGWSGDYKLPSARRTFPRGDR